ncbi:MAG: hypothetical protein K2V38_27545 [Gemmataceae bacterium]|nr:hypothetical protein [Gemmataceae bacterium]
MISRHLKLAAVAAVAFALFPSPAKAEVQILVEELNASSGVVGSSAFSVGSPTGGTTFFRNFTYSTPTGYFTLSGQVGTNSQLGTLNASLSTSFTGGFTSNFKPADGHTLRITVTDDKFTTNGLPTTLVNSAGVALGFAGGTIQVDSFSRIYNPGAAASTPASSTTALANGATIGGPTGTATDTLPLNPSNVRVTSASVSGLPSPYAIQQVVLISFTETGTIDPQSTFTGSAGARIDPTARPIPAPAGLVLALIGLPLLGARRLLRTRAD